jgi:hypothetical protein
MPQPRLSPKKTLAFRTFAVVSALLLTYAAAETACTDFLPQPTRSVGSDTFVIQEDTGGYLIDARRGYVITKEPTRFARVDKGQIQYVGTLRGNNMGFQGDRDFAVRKPPGVYRDLVLGDSFATEAFMEIPWCVRVEQAIPHREMLNCSQSGAGLANWWSVVTRYILPNKYEFDRVIFASITEDLRRQFTAADHRYEGVAGLCQMGWKPETFPTTADGAIGYLSVPQFDKVTPTEFTMCLEEGHLCRGPNSHHAIRPYLASRVCGILSGFISPPKPPKAAEWERLPVPVLPRASACGSFWPGANGDDSGHARKAKGDPGHCRLRSRP